MKPNQICGSAVLCSHSGLHRIRKDARDHNTLNLRSTFIDLQREMALIKLHWYTVTYLFEVHNILNTKYRGIYCYPD